MKKIYKISLVVLVAVGMVIFGIFTWNNVQANMSGNIPLPTNIDIAYKQSELLGMNKVIRYEVFDTSGIRYYVTEDKFNSMASPQKIGDNLYRMPNGEYLTCLNTK